MASNTNRPAARQAPASQINGPRETNDSTEGETVDTPDTETGEVSAAETATLNQRVRSGAIGRSGLVFTKKKTLTTPVLKIGTAPVYVRIESKMETSKQMKQQSGTAPKEPATICNVVDLSNDAECILIVGTMLKGVMNDHYPNDGYVGKSFEIVNHGRRGDKTYNTYSMNEVEVAEAPKPVPKSEGAAPA